MNRGNSKPINSVNFGKQTLYEYWKHVRTNLLKFSLVIFLIPASSLMLATLVPYYLSQAVGSLATQGSQTNHYLVLASIFGFIGVIFNYTGFRLLTLHEAKIQSSLLSNVAHRLFYKDYSFFANEKIGALTTKYIDFVRAYVTLQDLFIIRTLSFIVSMGVGLVLVANSAPILALILFLLIALMIVQIRITLKIRTPYRDKRKLLRSKIVGEVADALTNNIVVKTFARESYELNNTKKRTKALEYIHIKDIGIVTTEGALRNLITTLVQILAIWVAIIIVNKGYSDIATTIFALSFLQRIAAQVFTLGEMVNGYDNAFLEAAPMTEMLMRKNKITDIPNAQRLRNVTGEIVFNSVSYNYEDGNEAISGLSTTISPGEKIGIVGHSGAGKSTITKLLLRFDDLSEGEILIDGHNISEVTQESLREAIAYVPQEPMLFHRSLLENIGYGKNNATIAEITSAAKKAHAHDFIKNLPNGYETLVGERGVKLSGGQKQRVAIARAILKDAPILVLDEATSALDSESEKLIQDALNKLMIGRTSIVIAHRLSTIQKMDRILVLNQGKITEEGSHNQLLAMKGTYAKLWAHQSGGFLEDN